MSIFGNRIIWPGTNVVHWESRKAFTIRDYVSSLSERFSLPTTGYPKTVAVPIGQWFKNPIDAAISSGKFQSVEEYLKDAIKKESSEIPEYLTSSTIVEATYLFSCLNMLDVRFNFYNLSMPAETYRRTSEDFEMIGENNGKIGAFVRKDSPKIVRINHGMVMAAEDACQALLALWQQPAGIPINEFDDPIFLRGEKKKTTPFIEYTSDSGQDIPEYLRSIPPTIRSAFYCLSPSVTRQTLADHLSTMVLTWIISHEDAHKYCGHLGHFRQLDVAPADNILDELVAIASRDSDRNLRKAAEMEADLCATMRSVDYLFDSEFLGIITDWLPENVRKTIWLETSESKGLHAPQRLVLMRLLASSAIVPLSIFEGVSAATPLSQMSCYPHVLTRILNVIFTVASRAIDVSFNFPEHGVGRFNFNEVRVFFKLVLEDAKEIYNIIVQLMNREKEVTSFWDELDIEELSIGLTFVFFVYHGQASMLQIPLPIYPIHFGSCKDVICDFLVHKIRMHEARTKDFFTAKLEVNPSRRNKVFEDQGLAQQKLSICRHSFAL